MQYSNVVPGRFVSRPNRFLAQVETADGVQTCHVKNTGRCAELLLPGAPVWLQRFGADAKRKTKFDLIAVQKGALLLRDHAFDQWRSLLGRSPRRCRVQQLSGFFDA